MILVFLLLALLWLLKDKDRERGSHKERIHKETNIGRKLRSSC